MMILIIFQPRWRAWKTWYRVFSRCWKINFDALWHRTVIPRRERRKWTMLAERNAAARRKWSRILSRSHSLQPLTEIRKVNNSPTIYFGVPL